MADFVSLVLAIPDIVEGFVKLARFVMKFQSLERDHIETVEESIFFAKILGYYSGYVNTSDSTGLDHPSRPLLEEALRNACSALSVAEGVLNLWTERLSDGRKPKKQKFLRRITNSISDKILGRKSGTQDDDACVVISFRMYSKMSYLAFGSVEIKEAMARLDKWTTRLSQLLLTSPNLRYQGDMLRTSGVNNNTSNDVTFVVGARERSRLNQAVLVVDLSQLESMFDIDPLRKSNIYRISEGDYAGYIVDVRNLALRRDAIIENEARDTENICRLFADTLADSEYRARATVGILPCAGYAMAEDPTIHLLLFRPPAGTGTPKTLRSLLLSGPPEHSLDARLEFCVKLATSVLIVQSVGLVHKNIRPDSIVVIRQLSTDTSQQPLGTPYLLSFGQARNAAGPTSKEPYVGEALAKTLYIHPRHLAARRRKRYQMRDDIYSLGLCFLEIAIWKSLLKWTPDKNGFVCDFDVCQMSDDHYDEVLKQEGIPTDHDKCWLRRDTLVRFARKHVPTTMGNTFKDIVISCLLFGEAELSYRQTLEKTLEEDLHDETADSQSVMFVQDILSSLRSLAFSS